MIVVARPGRKQIIEEMVADLESLPDESLEEVRDLVEVLVRKTARPRRGSAQALLRSFGRWQGPPGELRQLMDESYAARHQEQ